MKNITLNISATLFSITLLLAACGKPLISNYSSKSATGNTRFVNQSSIVQMPLLVDLDIDDRIISGNYSGKDVTEEFAKSMAVANALKLAGGDVMVEPQYLISIENNSISVEVRGHAARYKNFRKPTSPDDKGSGTKVNYVKPDPNKTTIRR